MNEVFNEEVSVQETPYMYLPTYVLGTVLYVAPKIRSLSAKEGTTESGSKTAKGKKPPLTVYFLTDEPTGHQSHI